MLAERVLGHLASRSAAVLPTKTFCAFLTRTRQPARGRGDRADGRRPGRPEADRVVAISGDAWVQKCSALAAWGGRRHDGLRSWMGVSWLSGADGALLRSVDRESRAAGDISRGGERVRDVLAGAEVHLVGRLAPERRVGETRVVLGDVELDEGAHLRRRGQRVQEEPAVLEDSPPRLDHRVRVVDLRLGEDALEQAGRDQFVDILVLVLDARVGEEGRHRGAGLDGPARLDEDRDAGRGVEVIHEPPREDAPREVVDDRVEVEPGVVEKADQGRVDVPEFVRRVGSDADPRLLGVNAEPRTAPAALADEAVPGGRRGEHGAQPLSEEGEPPGRDVTEVGRGHHLPDGRDLVGRQPGGRRRRAGGLVVEEASPLGLTPGAEPGGGQTDDCEDAAQAEHALGTMDGAEQPGLLGRRDPQAGQVRLQDPQESEQDAQDGPQELVALLEARDPRPKYGRRGVGDGGRRHRPRRSSNPALRGRPRHAEPDRDGRVARLLDELDEPMVVDLLDALRLHPAKVHRGGRRGGLGPTEPGGDRDEFSPEERRMSWLAAPFDAGGRRVLKSVVGGTSDRVIYSGANAVVTYGAPATWKRNTVYQSLIDRPLMVEQADVLDEDGDANVSEVTRSYYHADAIGSTKEISTASQGEASSYRYDPFGEAVISRGGVTQTTDPIGQSIAFTGRDLDEESGQYHYRARVVSPTLGRFLQRDPLGVRSAASSYEYAANAPTMFVDPFGLAPTPRPPPGGPHGSNIPKRGGRETPAFPNLPWPVPPGGWNMPNPTTGEGFGRLSPMTSGEEGGPFCGPFKQDDRKNTVFYGSGWWFKARPGAKWFQYALRSVSWLPPGSVGSPDGNDEKHGDVVGFPSGQPREDPSLQGGGFLVDQAGTSHSSFGGDLSAQAHWFFDYYAGLCNPQPPAGTLFLTYTNELWTYEYQTDPWKVLGYYYWYFQVTINLATNPPEMTIDNNGDLGGGDSAPPVYNPIK